jgi:hypothetical protein
LGGQRAPQAVAVSRSKKLGQEATNAIVPAVITRNGFGVV